MAFPIALAASLAKPLISKLLGWIPDKDKHKQIEAELQKDIIGIIQSGVEGQLAINQQEAAHKSLFVAGWRPAVGWCCAVGVFWAFVGQPIANWSLSLFGYEANLPEIMTDNLFELLLGMLGMGGLRTWEKLKGVERK